MQGAAVTSGLRKVTDDMKTKNRADRSGVVAAAAAAPAANAGADTWTVQHSALPEAASPDLAPAQGS